MKQIENPAHLLLCYYWLKIGRFSDWEKANIISNYLIVILISIFNIYRNEWCRWMGWNKWLGLVFFFTWSIAEHTWVTCAWVYAYVPSLLTIVGCNALPERLVNYKTFFFKKLLKIWLWHKLIPCPAN